MNLERPARELVDRHRLLHVQQTDFRHESRVFKESFSALRSGLLEKVKFLGWRRAGGAQAHEEKGGIQIRRPVETPAVPRRGKVRAAIRMARVGRDFYRAILREKPDLIHCHSVASLPVCVLAGRRLDVPVVYDAHELEIDCGENWRQRIVDRAAERTFIRGASAVICVSNSIADWYASHYGLERPIVVRNVPDVRIQTDHVGSRVLRDRFGLAEDDLLFIYQGALFPGRRVEQLLRVFARVRSGRHLVFMGSGELEASIRHAANRHPNIHFQPAVAPDDVLRHTASADVGIVGVENICLSYYFSLPNKLFEYLVAGLPFMVPDFPEMRATLGRHACGWVVGENDEDWISTVNTLDRGAVQAAKANAQKASLEYSWAREEVVLVDVYRALLHRRVAARSA